MESSKQCSHQGCSAQASDFCIFCKKDYCEEHIFNHECNQSDEENMNSGDNSNENIQESNENKCATPICKAEALDYCILCKKNYCEKHFIDHDCNPAEYPPKNKASKDDDSNMNENGEEYVDNKCDFLCCTMEAPFFCPICQLHYCERHALDHECYGNEIQIKNSTIVNETKNNNNNSNSNISNNSTQENGEEAFDNKCDYLGCTGEAPFFCSICNQHYCAKHALRHDCKI